MRKKAITKEIQSQFTPYGVLKDLMDGNKRFVNNNNTPSDFSELAKQTSCSQFPKAVVLSCIDSRVLVEMVFDQTIGDLFVARVAGNFENIDILGSIEYSCKVAGGKLVFVLGHENCGAVRAACDGLELGNITAMLSKIIPAVTLSEKEIDGEKNSSNKEFVDRAILNNVKLTISRIREKSLILSEMEKKGDIIIVGGVYSLKSREIVLV